MVNFYIFKYVKYCISILRLLSAHRSLVAEEGGGLLRNASFNEQS